MTQLNTPQLTGGPTSGTVVSRPWWARDRFAFLIFAILVPGFLIYFARTVMQQITGPLLGLEDYNNWSYMGWYVAHNLRLFPLPKLNLVNDQTFYPYGTASVFQSWGFERDVYFAGVWKLFGNGPWLQWYYIASLLISAFGTFALLRPVHGVHRAAIAGFVVTFANYFAIDRYPRHLCFSCIHWMTLNIIADYLLARRVILKEKISPRFLLFRAALLTLALGQDLGYVCGISLTSFVLTAGYVALVWMARRAKNRDFSAARAAMAVRLKNLPREFQAHPWQNCLLLFVAFACTWLYVPLILQVAHVAHSFNFAGAPEGYFFASPIRLLVPWLPGFNPTMLQGMHLGDLSDENLGSAPGLFYIFFGTLGLITGRRKIAMFVPLLIFFAAAATYNPHAFPILKIFPWFSFARVATRFTIIMPVILLLFGLATPNLFWRSRPGRMTAAALGLLLIAEMATAYHVQLQNERPYFQPDAQFLAFMETVKKTPGEAVLEWPFCIAAGSGYAAADLGPFYGRQSSIFGLRQFHEKKIVGEYFGRLAPAQAQPFYDAGWPAMFSPNSTDIHLAAHQTRDWSPQQWAFFEAFYKLNDFAGIVLYADMLSPQMRREFHQRFGQPIAETSYLAAGRMEFIPKPAAWRSLVNPAAGKTVKLDTPIMPADFGGDIPITTRDAYAFQLAGWYPTDAGQRCIGGTATLVFRLDHPRHMRLEITGQAFGPQNIAILVNGKIVGGINQELGIKTIVCDLPADLLSERNTIAITASNPRVPAELSPEWWGDTRSLGMIVQSIRLLPEK